MRRTLFNLTIALLAFGIGSFVVFSFLNQKSEKEPDSKIETKITIKSESEKNIGRGFGVGYRNNQIKESDFEPKSYKATCSDKNLLPLWNELKKDKVFKETEKDGFYQTGDCSKLIEIERKDLNDDGQKEFIVWGRYNFSGGTGNTIVWIYEKQNGRYKQLLQSSAFREDNEKWFEVKEDKTKNYHNLLLKGHFTASETTNSFFKFNGSRYVENKCWFEIRVDEKTQVTMSCNEYNEQTEKELRESEKKLESN